MTSYEFMQDYDRLTGYFNSKPNETRAEVWFSRLRHHSVDTWSKAVDAMVEQERYLPALGSAVMVCGRISPTSASNTGGQVDVELMPAEIDLNRDLFPLFRKMVEALAEPMKSQEQKSTAVGDFKLQMCFFSQKHGLHGKMFQNESCQVCGTKEPKCPAN